MVDCISSSTAVNSGSSGEMSTRTVDWLEVLGGGCQITGAERGKIDVSYSSIDTILKIFVKLFLTLHTANHNFFTNYVQRFKM